MNPAAAQIALLRKFAHLYDSGVSLADALDLARAELPDELHDVMGEVLDDLYRGTSLADALAARPGCFGPEVIALVRAGELRGELSEAARSAADGLEEGVLAGVQPDPAGAEALLLAAGDARFVHIEDGVVSVRTKAGLVRREEPAPPGAVVALLERGAFLWEDRLVRVARAGRHVTVEISGVPGEEPPEARRWREKGEGILVLEGGRRADFDAALRSILRAYDPESTLRVAVGLPVPEAVPVSDVAGAVRLDPDVVAVRRAGRAELEALARAGVPGIVVGRGGDLPDGAACATCAIR